MRGLALSGNGLRGLFLLVRAGPFDFPDGRTYPADDGRSSASGTPLQLGENSVISTIAKPLPSPQRMLIVLPSWLGDTVMATPALRALRRQFPRAQVTYLGRSGPLAVLANAP